MRGVVCPGERGLVEGEAVLFGQSLEDRGSGLTGSMLVRENHDVDRCADAEVVEDATEGMAGRAAGVADETDPEAAPFERRNAFGGMRYGLRRDRHNLFRVRLLPLLDGAKAMAAIATLTSRAAQLLKLPRPLPPLPAPRRAGLRPPALPDTRPAGAVHGARPGLRRQGTGSRRRARARARPGQKFRCFPT